MFLESLIARFGPALLDVILAIPDPSGSTLALSCEIAGYKAIRQPGVTLTTFARQHFGHGRLRKVGPNLYAVLRGTPAIPAATIHPIRAGKAPVFPSWVYHV